MWLSSSLKVFSSFFNVCEKKDKGCFSPDRMIYPIKRGSVDIHTLLPLYH